MSLPAQLGFRVGEAQGAGSRPVAVGRAPLHELRGPQRGHAGDRLPRSVFTDYEARDGVVRIAFVSMPTIPGGQLSGTRQVSVVPGEGAPGSAAPS